MYASSEKKIDILNDHYKDTFSHLVSYRKQCDRVLLYLLGIAAVAALYLIFPDGMIDVVFKAISKKIGIEVVLHRISKMLLLLVPVMVLLVILSHRYRQVRDLIESQYDYLAKLEEELASLYTSGIPFTRESKFSLKGQDYSLWNNRFYDRCFFLLLFILLVLCGTYALRRFGLSWSWFVGYIILITSFCSAIIKQSTLRRNKQ